MWQQEASKTLLAPLSHQRTLQVVCEEAPDAHAYGQRKSQKRRYVAGVVTPAQPEYMHGLVDGGPDVALDDAAPLLGVSASVGGYQVEA